MNAREPIDPRLTIHELRRRAEAGLLSEEDLRLYFRKDARNSKPFEPALKLNTRVVELDGETPTPSEVSDIYAAANRAAAARADANSMRLGAGPPKPKLLAEGDSWFNLPDFLWPPTSVDLLRTSFDVNNLAMWGDEIVQMLARKQYLVPLKSGLYSNFMFSGGGNDVLGSIPLYVKRRRTGDTDPGNAASYIKPEFAAKIAELMASYDSLANEVRVATAGRAVLYVHGYANAIPKRNGKYLGKPLEKLGFDPVDNRLLARAIVAAMVKLFNDGLHSLAASRAHVVYVDLRGSMASSDWYTDEIHP